MIDNHQFTDLYVYFYLAVIVALIFLKIGLRRTINKDIDSSQKLFHFICPNCGEFNNEVRKDCASCGSLKKEYRNSSICLFCGDNQLKSFYGINPEFWVTLFIWLIFPPMMIFYFLGYFFKRVCRNCGHMIQQTDYK